MELEKIKSEVYLIYTIFNLEWKILAKRKSYIYNDNKKQYKKNCFKLVNKKSIKA